MQPPSRDWRRINRHPARLERTVATADAAFSGPPSAAVRRWAHNAPAGADTRLRRPAHRGTREAVDARLQAGESLRRAGRPRNGREGALGKRLRVERGLPSGRLAFRQASALLYGPRLIDRQGGPWSAGPPPPRTPTEAGVWRFRGVGPGPDDQCPDRIEREHGAGASLPG